MLAVLTGDASLIGPAPEPDADHSSWALLRTRQARRVALARHCRWASYRDAAPAGCSARSAPIENPRPSAPRWTDQTAEVQAAADNGRIEPSPRDRSALERTVAEEPVSPTGLGRANSSSSAQVYD